VLVDGSVSQFDICPAEVEWGGIWQTILVSVLGNETLLGMRMLEGHKLVIAVVPGGLVEILPLNREAVQRRFLSATAATQPTFYLGGCRSSTSEKLS
jgi:hypothetical protein